MEIRKYLSERKKAVEQSLDNLVPAATGPFSKHIEAMRYSLFAGGKRVRPILCLAAADAVGVEEDSADALFPIACALECIHTYSLIHDDLPAMDDDALRRGKATSHILFGEAGAILAGDGLLTLAFELLSDPAVSVIGSDRQLEIINLVSSCAGPLGMVGGQSLDMEMEQQEFPFSTLEQIHR
ncbi:MAG: polyprenyl synthetase family protein, partial [Thermodesulfobacteriota bacterium]